MQIEHSARAALGRGRGAHWPRAVAWARAASSCPPLSLCTATLLTHGPAQARLGCGRFAWDAGSGGSVRVSWHWWGWAYRLGGGGAVSSGRRRWAAAGGCWSALGPMSRSRPRPEEIRGLLWHRGWHLPPEGGTTVASPFTPPAAAGAAAARSLPSRPVGRRGELDVMRALVVAGLVVFHSAVVFAAGASWFVKDPRPSVGFTVFLLWGSLWGMPLLFLVSGMGVRYAMRTRAGRGVRRRAAGPAGHPVRHRPGAAGAADVLPRTGSPSPGFTSRTGGSGSAS